MASRGGSSHSAVLLPVGGSYSDFLIGEAMSVATRRLAKAPRPQRQVPEFSQVKS